MKSGNLNNVKLIGLLALVGVLIAPSAYAQNAPSGESSYRSKAKKLSDLRGKIERLESEIQVEREVRSNEIQSLISQSEEIELLIQKEKIRLSALKKMISDKADKVNQDQTAISHLREPVLASISEVRNTVEKGLPFRIDERVTELNEISQSLSASTIDPFAAVSRLWQFVEDELKLSTETGQYRQVVETDTGRVLADVIRIGMLLMYYRTEDLRFGTTTLSNGKYIFEPVTDKGAIKGIQALFESLDKQVRQGQFNLPLKMMAPGGTAK